jgi:hypothetical protein
MTRFYLALSLLLGSLSSVGQGLAGYVLTLHGDTLRGTVREKGERIYLDSKSSDEPESFTAYDLKAYAVAGNRPVYSQIVRPATGPAARRFVVLELAGSASLYNYSNEAGLLLAPAATDTLYELTAQNWHLLFNRFLTTCPTIRQTDDWILQLPFERRSVLQVLTPYNRCVDAQWQPSQPSATEPWRQSFLIQVSGLRGYFDGNTPRTVPSVGLTWAGLRASGLLVGLRLDYTYLQGYSDVHSTFVDQRYFSRLGLLTGSGSVGKRWGRPYHPNFFFGGGFGFSVVAHNRREIQQRPPGSNEPFQTVGFTGRPNQFGLQADLHSGVFVPLTPRHELRLSVTAMLRSPFAGWGLQAAYCWNR